MKDNKKPPTYIYNSNPITVTGKRIMDEEESSSGTFYRGGSQVPRKNIPNKNKYTKPKYTAPQKPLSPRVVKPVIDKPSTTPTITKPNVSLPKLLPSLPKWITPIIPFLLSPTKIGNPKLDPFNPNIPGKYLKKIDKPEIDRVTVKLKSKK